MIELIFTAAVTLLLILAGSTRSPVPVPVRTTKR